MFDPAISNSKNADKFGLCFGNKTNETSGAKELRLSFYFYQLSFSSKLYSSVHYSGFFLACPMFSYDMLLHGSCRSQHSYANANLFCCLLAGVSCIFYVWLLHASFYFYSWRLQVSLILYFLSFFGHQKDIFIVLNFMILLYFLVASDSFFLLSRILIWVTSLNHSSAVFFW